jgi:hypothetical protein
MFGIDDPWILTGYALCFISTAFGVIYGYLKWNEEVD